MTLHQCSTDDMEHWWLVIALLQCRNWDIMCQRKETSTEPGSPLLFPSLLVYDIICVLRLCVLRLKENTLTQWHHTWLSLKFALFLSLSRSFRVSQTLSTLCAVLPLYFPRLPLHSCSHFSRQGSTTILPPLPKYPPILHSIMQDDEDGWAYKRREGRRLEETFPCELNTFICPWAAFCVIYADFAGMGLKAGCDWLTFHFQRTCFPSYTNRQTCASTSPPGSQLKAMAGLHVPSSQIVCQGLHDSIIL